MKIRILSLPSRHPYTSKFNQQGINFINPDTDLFNTTTFTPEFLNQNYPPSNYDIVHIHFSFDKLSLENLEKALMYFKANNKPIVWTLHSKESQRIKNYGNGLYQKLLFKYSDKIISPSLGAKEWCNTNLGIHKNIIDVIPLGFMSSPKEISYLAKGVKKEANLFTMLIGEFRENKEFLQSVVNFLQCSKLINHKLLLIFKPIPLINSDGQINPQMKFFFELINNSRIETLSLPEITNEELNKAFLRSHAVIVAYKWGTHSGVVEQARDCGCHVVASDVGFYKEQWSDVTLYNYNSVDPIKTGINYTKALLEVADKPLIKPAGQVREDELKISITEHKRIYKELIN